MNWILFFIGAAAGSFLGLEVANHMGTKPEFLVSVPIAMFFAYAFNHFGKDM